MVQSKTITNNLLKHANESLTGDSLSPLVSHNTATPKGDGTIQDVLKVKGIKEPMVPVLISVQATAGCHRGPISVNMVTAKPMRVNM